MGARSTMKHRATIERDANATADDGEWGQKPDPDWQDHITKLACHVWYEAGREVVGTDNAVVEGLRMIVPLGTDVTEADRVSTVTDRQENELQAFNFPARIESVGSRADHLVCFLEAI